MNSEHYIVATLKSWNIKVFNEVIKHFPGTWSLITDFNELTVENIKKINPEFIFFPHWNHIVPTEILELVTCICFHETDLPFGRGGSPVQNLISQGHRKTVVSALKMTEDLDAGPVYLKRSMSLEGLGEEVFIRASLIIAEMIEIIISKDLEPITQAGVPTYFKRRKPKQSEIPAGKNDLLDIFDHIRMLDAEGYPRAYLIRDSFRYEISRPALKTGEILADVRITRIDGNLND